MRRSERGFTLVEIMIVVAIIALLAAIAIPNVLRGRATANETAAIGNMRALLSSLEMYRSVNSAYPSNWTQMSAANPAFYPQPYQVMPSTVQGYIYAYGNFDANTYNLTAVPSAATGSGSRQFWTDQTGQVRHCSSSSSTVGVSAASNTISGPPNIGCP